MVKTSAHLFSLLFRIGFAIAATRPNFIFLLTDDQDVTLDSMQAMPNTLRYIAQQGITFSNTFVSTPICCPSRTETIAGRNFHNVKHDNENCMHVASKWNIFNNSDSWFQLFQRNGYKTGLFGKLVNDQAAFWCNTDTPNNAGFDRVNSPCNQNDFYNTKWYDKYENGSWEQYTLNISQDMYQTSYIGNASHEFLQKRLSDRQPFMMWIGPHAPHYPATPSAWYADRFSNVTSPLAPNFNQSDKQKHSFVGSNPSISESAKDWIDQLYRDRLRSLLSVDDIVYDLVHLLMSDIAVYQNTYFLLTSDHGYHLGQYDIPCSKQQPYEETVRVPLYFSGPSLTQRNVTREELVGNIDILPTFLSLAGIDYDANTYDGRSWVDGEILNGDRDSVSTSKLTLTTKTKDAWRTVYLSQYQSVGTYGFSHCQTWFPSDNGSVVPGQLLSPPDHNDQGLEWIVDDMDTNNWRALRIMNESVDWMYAEFVNSSWNDTTFENPYCVEFYDIAEDPFQRKNSADTALSAVQKQQLHEMLMMYGACTGTQCW